MKTLLFAYGFCDFNKDNELDCRKQGEKMLTVDNIFTEYTNIVTTSDLMEMLEIGKNTALKLLQSKTIKSVKVGNRYKIPKQYVIDYLNERT